MFTRAVLLTICLGGLSCTGSPVDFSPNPEVIYKIIDPATGKQHGAIVFHTSDTYLLTYAESTTCIGEPCAVSTEIVGHWNSAGQRIILADQVLKSMRAYNKWGEPIKLGEQTWKEMRARHPIPDCKKVKHSGADLVML